MAKEDMASPLSQPLGCLSVTSQPVCASSYSCMDGFGFYLIWFLILAIIAWIVIWSIKPDWILNLDGSVNAGKVLLWSIVIGLIGIFIIWLIKRCGRTLC